MNDKRTAMLEEATMVQGFMYDEFSEWLEALAFAADRAQYGGPEIEDVLYPILEGELKVSREIMVEDYEDSLPEYLGELRAIWGDEFKNLGLPNWQPIDDIELLALGM